MDVDKVTLSTFIPSFSLFCVKICSLWLFGFYFTILCQFIWFDGLLETPQLLLTSFIFKHLIHVLAFVAIFFQILVVPNELISLTLILLVLFQKISIISKTTVEKSCHLKRLVFIYQ